MLDQVRNRNATPPLSSTSSVTFEILKTEKGKRTIRMVRARAFEERKQNGNNCRK